MAIGALAVARLRVSSDRKSLVLCCLCAPRLVPDVQDPCAGEPVLWPQGSVHVEPETPVVIAPYPIPAPFLEHAAEAHVTRARCARSRCHRSATAIQRRCRGKAVRHVGGPEFPGLRHCEARAISFVADTASGTHSIENVKSTRPPLAVRCAATGTNASRWIA